MNTSNTYIRYMQEADEVHYLSSSDNGPQTATAW